MSVTIQPVILLFVTALINVTRIRKLLWFPVLVVVDSLVALVVWWFLPIKSSIAPWWGPLTTIAARWPLIWKKRPGLLAHGGPLGKGCAKLVEVLVAIVLWRLLHQEWPGLSLGPVPGIQAWVGISFLSIAVNTVLQLWSRQMQSRGDHKGVNEMVESTRGRPLSRNERVKILSLAFLNGACEEITSRWFWMAEFRTYLKEPHAANLAQAAVFGIWHYHGIPSGFTGVALTFVYGFVMGLLFEYGEGLFLPIVAHGIADYYIFAVIVRQKQEKEH